ncbi:P-loop containing nucleoside triphosphate hydrolase protein [Cyathus striatus]|nr:P-loop containing nucleoside triphosphate hydrolase protein [Cyathus striatus]
MAPTKKSSSSSISLKKVKGENFYRNAKQVGRLKMLTGGKAIRDKDGKIIQAAAFQKGEDETKPGRVQPDRRWFERRSLLCAFTKNKLPMALLDDAANPNLRKRPHIVETEPFSETFGPKSQRKKPRELSKISSASLEVAENAATQSGAGVIEPLASSVVEPQTHADYNEPIYAKGTSRRIYGELYKVIDSSDVILHILDARDPMGTMCESVLEYIKKEKSHKQVVLIINKCDLVPNWVTARYIQHLTPRYPTIAFHASPNHSQFSQLHSDKKQISVGFIGYPNVGKSSVINTLKSNKVCTVAPVPGETKVWQYITLTRRIYLIDCPGIVPTSAHDSHTATVLKGVVRVEALPTPSEHIPALMERIKPAYLSKTYNVPLPNKDDPTQSWEPEVFLEKLARMKGRLLKRGEPDLDSVAKIVLSDWVRGRIPFFVPPPERPEEVNVTEAKKKAKDWKGKGKAMEAKDLPGVKQNLGSIMQKNTFLAEDIRPLEEEFIGVEEPSGEGVNDDDVEEAAARDGEEEEELKWSDIFEGIKEEVVADDSNSEGQEGSDDEAIDDVEVLFLDDAAKIATEDEARKKETRMKTNKRKAENFYSKANVKNKNRSKAALMKTLPIGKRPESRKKK